MGDDGVGGEKEATREGSLYSQAKRLRLGTWQPLSKNTALRRSSTLLHFSIVHDKA